MSTELESRWRDALGDRTELDLTDDPPAAFAPLIDAMSPPDLRAVPDAGSMVWENDGRLVIDFDGYLVPVGGATSERAGLVHRCLNLADGWAEHVDFSLSEEWSRQGRGRKAICAAVNLYLQLDLQAVFLNATEVGSYVWAQCGFDFADQATRDEVVEAADQFLARLDLEADLSQVEHSWDFARLAGTTTIEAVAAVRPDGAEELLDLGALGDPETPIELGKALLLVSEHGGWSGVLDLSAQSPGLVQLARYAGCDELGDR